MTHGYKRNGTTILFAALNILDENRDRALYETASRVTLDSLVEEYGAQDYEKVDVEGFDL